MVSKFTDHVAEAEAMAPGGGAQEVVAQRQRQRAFMKRDASSVAGNQAAAWAPRKKYRVTARNWILHMDSQVGMRTVRAIERTCL